MKHAAFVILALAVAGLAACTERVAPEDIRLTRRSETVDDWSRFLPGLYRGLDACLAAHPARPAYAQSVVPQNHGMMLVYLVGADGSRMACSVDTTASRQPELVPSTPLKDQELRGPRFTPASMAEPFLPCGSNEPVLTVRGRLLGWLTYSQADCSETALPRQRWRAFGNAPIWSATIGPGGIFFDRVGALPLSYPARAGQTAGNRMTWVIDTPDSSARERLDVVITKMPCRDNVTGHQYDYRAEAIFPGRSFTGCAIQMPE